MIYVTATSTKNLPSKAGEWNLHLAAVLGAFVAATYILAMFGLSHVISFKSLTFVLSMTIIGATVGAITTLAIAALLNLVKRSERKRAASLDEITTLALARLA